MARAIEGGPPDDRELVAGALAGQRECFGELVERYWEVAVALAAARTGSVQAAEDVAQDAFVRAYRCLDSLRDPSRFAGWLLAIVSQRCVDEARARRRTEELRGGGPDLDQLAAAAPCPEPAGADLRLVRSAVAALPEKYQQVVVMRFVGGLSTREIARRLGLRPGTVRVRLHRAYGKLRAELAPALEEA